MIIKVRQLLLRLGLVLAFVILFAGLLILKRQPAAQDQTLLETEAEREAWLNLRGWRVSEPEVSEAVLPAEWTTLNGQRWLSLQQEQGLAPELYAGKPVTRYLYPIENGEKPELYAELYLCENALCGAQIYDAETGIMRVVR